MQFAATKHVDKVWGFEEWLVNNDRYCGKRLVVSPGWQCSLHHHKIKHETFYLLSGRLLMEYGGSRAIMNPGDVLVIEPGTNHRFTGLGREEAVVIEFSTTHDDADVYRDDRSRFVGTVCIMLNESTS